MFTAIFRQNKNEKGTVFGYSIAKNKQMNTYATAANSQNILNIPYGNHAQQVMDIYLPANRTTTTKTFILLHGGGWSGGSKEQLSFVIPLLKAAFPDCAVANINYRLATAEDPAFPKQIQDIEMALQFLKGSTYNLSAHYAFIGISAGAHLAMLYSYKYDIKHEVKAITSIVGPADFTDPYYTAHPYYQYAALYLLGDVANHPEAALGISPAIYVNTQSAPTIMFYGGKDLLVPSSQAKRLKAKLDAFGIANQLYVYPNGGHTNWNVQVMDDFKVKLIAFLKEHF
jgi:acetyl esterase/lipase